MRYAHSNQKLLAVEQNRDIKDFNIFSFEKSDKYNFVQRLIVAQFLNC